MLHLLSTLVVFALLLGVLVVFHEFGHFTAARYFGMKIYEFAFGFGPVIARLFRRSGTEFNVRAVPLGGFVRIAGMEPGEEGDVEGGFNSKPIRQRALTILAGPFMSLLLGYIVFLLIGFVWGFATDTPTTRVASISLGTPAARAGLREGDVFVAINGKRLADGNQMLKTIRSSAGKELTIELRRDGRPLTIKAAPRMQYLKSLKKKVAVLGFVPEPKMERTGVVESVKRGSVRTYEFLMGTIRGLFSKEIKNAGGILAIGVMTGQAVKAGTQYVLFLLAALSVTLAVINLVPWPVLDGGHMLYLLIEKVRGKRLEPERWYWIQAFGLAVIVALAIFMVGYDISRIGEWTGLK